jgi:hypothetical protein
VVSVNLLVTVLGVGVVGAGVVVVVSAGVGVVPGEADVVVCKVVPSKLVVPGESDVVVCKAVPSKLVVPGEAGVVVSKFVSCRFVVPGEADVVFCKFVVVPATCVTGGAAVVSEEADAVVCEVLSGKLGTQQVLK